VLSLAICFDVVFAYPDAAEAKKWVKIHNTYRCMHGTPYIGWSDDVAKVAFDYGMTLSSLIHSKSYDVPPPGGPAGENLAQGYPDLESAVGGWYSEVKNCEALPGCETGKAGAMVGHFTAMIWMGVKFVGCGINPATTIYTCHYYSADTLGPWTDNMAGGYQLSVPPANGKTFEQCQAEAPDTHWPNRDVKSLYPAQPGGGAAAIPYTPPTGGGSFMGMIWHLLIAVVMIVLIYCIYVNVSRRVFGSSYDVTKEAPAMGLQQYHLETQMEQAGGLLMEGANAGYQEANAKLEEYQQAQEIEAGKKAEAEKPKEKKGKMAKVKGMVGGII
jgi:hypothetical protein